MAEEAGAHPPDSPLPPDGFLREEDPQRLRDEAGDRAVLVEFELHRDSRLKVERLVVPVGQAQVHRAKGGLSVSPSKVMARVP